MCCVIFTQKSLLNFQQVTVTLKGKLYSQIVRAMSLNLKVVVQANELWRHLQAVA